MTRKLILVGGMPGSGQTYIGKELARNTGLFVAMTTIIVGILIRKLVR